MRLIDSSAIIKFFAKEPGWKEIEAYLPESMTIPLAIEELGNALWKKVLLAEIKEKDAEEIIALYQSIAVLAEYKPFTRTALEIAVKEKIAFYDSLFLAVAMKNDYEFVTCDRLQAKIARKLGITVVEC